MQSKLSHKSGGGRPKIGWCVRISFFFFILFVLIENPKGSSTFYPVVVSAHNVRLLATSPRVHAKGVLCMPTGFQATAAVEMVIGKINFKNRGDVAAGRGE